MNDRNPPKDEVNLSTTAIPTSKRYSIKTITAAIKEISAAAKEQERVVFEAVAAYVHKADSQIVFTREHVVIFNSYDANKFGFSRTEMPFIKVSPMVPVGQMVIAEQTMVGGVVATSHNMNVATGS